ESFADSERKEIGSALEAVHRTTARAIDDWLAGIDREAGAWARSPLIRTLATSASSGARGPGALELLAPLGGRSGFAGYLIVDPSGRVLVGDEARSIDEVMSRALTAAVIAELKRSPDHSVVVLPEGRLTEPGDQAELRGEILVAAAVPDRRDPVGSVLILRFDPRVDLA